MTPSTRRRYERELKRAREQSMLVVAATTAVTDRRRERRRKRGDSDGALIEREIDTIIAAQENDMLAAIERALLVLETTPESFGHCAECGREIDQEYLDIAPWLSHCIEHAHGAITF